MSDCVHLMSAAAAGVAAVVAALCASLTVVLWTG